MLKTKEAFSKHWQEKAFLYSLLFFAVLLPFQPKTPPLTLGIMLAGLVWLISLNFKSKLAALGNSRVAVFMLAYLLWCIVGLLYTDNLKEGSQDVFQKVPFLAFVAFFCASPVFRKRYKGFLVNAFIISAGIICGYSFISAFIDYNASDDALRFHFEQLTLTSMVPPHYLAMFLNFGYGILLYNILRGHSLIKRWLDIFLALLFFITIVFLSVRMQYATFIIVNLLIVWRYSAQRKGSLFAWGAVLVLLAVFTAGVLSYEGSRRRIGDAVNEAISFNRKVNDKQTNHRKFLWQYGWRSIQEKPILGHGTGAADEALHQALQASDAQFWDGHDLYYIRDVRYNFHNEYLQQFATHGAIGLFILLVMLFAPILGMQLDYRAKVFLLVCALSFLTESMLQRQAGILFFSFFYTLLLPNRAEKAISA